MADPNRYLHLPRSEATLDVEWLLFTLLASDAKRAYSSTWQQPGVQQKTVVSVRNTWYT